MTHRIVRVLRLSLIVCFTAPAFCASDGARSEAKPEHEWFVASNGPKNWRILARMAKEVEFSEVRLRNGDDPGWAGPDFDDGAWKIVARGRPVWLPSRSGPFWLRLRVRWNSPEGRLPNAVHLFFLLASYDVYWDGVLIGRNGAPAATRDDEVEGVKEFHTDLPLALTGPGEHLLAMRVSTWHAADPADYSPLLVSMMTPAAFEEMFRRDNVLPMMASGALLTIMIAALVMWVVAARRRVLLLFAIMCFFGGVMEAVYWFTLAYVYPVSWHYPLTLAAALSGLVVSLSLAAIVIEEWSMPRGSWWFAPLLAADALLLAHAYPFLEQAPAQFIGASFGFVLGASVWAAIRKKPNVWAIAATVALSSYFLWDEPDHFVGLEFFQRFMPTAMGLLLAIALRLRTERRQVQETKLTAARLEIELLKKNLQPHFLMNTLTALAQTVEEAPASAVKLIDDLAQEFRTLARMAGEKAVPLSQELELCRAHLRVMQARTDVPWTLDADDVDATATVPPALFLTLIENGFTHQRAQKGQTVFTLRSSANGHGVRYTFRSPGEVTEETNRSVGGTGLRYVKARLEESFPGAWSLTQGEVDGGWQTEIELGFAVRGVEPP